MLQFFALIPHHNTLSDIESIQEIAHGYPLYPVIVPLCCLSRTTTESEAALTRKQLKSFIKEQQAILRKCSLTIASPKFQNSSTAKKLICPIEGLPNFTSTYTTETDEKILEPFTKNAFTLTYTEPAVASDLPEQDSPKQDLSEVQLAYDKASLTMRIYRIGIVTVTELTEQNMQGFSWTISHDLWVKE